MDIIDIPEGFVDAEEPSDAHLMRNFASSIRVGPSQQMSGRVFYMGKDWDLQAALEAERADYLHQARTRWLGYRDAFRARKRAQKRQLEEQRAFEEKAAQGVYAKALRSELDKTKVLHQSGCQLAGELQSAKAEKARLPADTELDLDKLRRALADVDDLIVAITARLAAAETNYRAELQVLSETTGFAIRELYFRWSQAREALIKRVIAALRVIVSIGGDRDREVVDWVSIRAHSVVSLDNSAGCLRNSLKIGWRYDKKDTLNLAQEVAERVSQFERYLQGQTYRDWEKTLEPRSVA